MPNSSRDTETCDWNPGNRYAASYLCSRAFSAIGDRYSSQKGVPVVLILLLLALVSHIFAQQGDQTRGLRVKRIEESRPASTTPADPKRPSTYRSATSTASSSELRKMSGGSDAIIGVTLWRLRPAQPSDSQGARLLEHQGSKNNEWTAERIEADARISEGERVRVSIESPSTGHLYVIDREQYADGTLGDAYLIFPTARTRGGNNTVVAGRVIEFPAQEDNPPFLTLTRSRADHVGELLTLIVSPQPLADLPIGAEPTKVAPEKIAAWEKEWGGQTEQFELEGGAGLPYTITEKAAASGEASRMLTQGDPLPQTILRLTAKPGHPVVVRMNLRIGK